MCRSEPTIRLPAASRKRLWPVVPFTALFFFSHLSALTLIDGDSFSPGHPAGFHLDAAIIKGQYTERLRRIGGWWVGGRGGIGGGRRIRGDYRARCPELSGLPADLLLSISPGAKTGGWESTQAAAETINKPAACGSEPGVKREPIKSRMAPDIQELAEASEMPSARFMQTSRCTSACICLTHRRHFL